MDQYKPNYKAVVIAGVVMWVLGAVWYSLFGSLWMTFTGVTEEMTTMMTTTDTVMMYGGSIVAFIVVFYVQDHIMFTFKASSIKDAVTCGFWMWLGFIATSFFVQLVYQMKPYGLWFIDTGYWLLSMIVGSIILAAMKKKSESPAES